MSFTSSRPLTNGSCVRCAALWTWRRSWRKWSSKTNKNTVLSLGTLVCLGIILLGKLWYLMLRGSFLVLSISDAALNPSSLSHPGEVDVWEHSLEMKKFIKHSGFLAACRHLENASLFWKIHAVSLRLELEMWRWPAIIMVGCIHVPRIGLPSDVRAVLTYSTWESNAVHFIFPGKSIFKLFCLSVIVWYVLLLYCTFKCL